MILWLENVDTAKDEVETEYNPSEIDLKRHDSNSKFCHLIYVAETNKELRKIQTTEFVEEVSKECAGLGSSVTKKYIFILKLKN